jgi:hypothetical protein
MSVIGAKLKRAAGAVKGRATILGVSLKQYRHRRPADRDSAAME